MSTQTIGHAAHRAVTFLKEFYNDVHTLVTTLDGMMDSHGWRVPPDMGSRISSELGNGLRSTSWVLTSLSRIYVPHEQGSSATRAITFSADFTPAGFDESICMIVAAEFDPPVSIYGELWKSWRAWDHVLERLRESPGPVELTRNELDADFMPKASRARVFLVPLARLDDQLALENEVVKKALELIST